MDITNRTTIGDAAPFITEEHLKTLIDSDKIKAIDLEKPIIKMTVGEFLEALDPAYAIEKFFSDPDELLVNAVGRIKTFKKEIEDISNVLKVNEISLSVEEKAAQRGVVFPSYEESVLCECVEWFHLHSLDDAEKVPLSNYIVMHRKHSAEALFDRNLNKIYNEKAKKRTK